jgi:hypothetical protein
MIIQYQKPNKETLKQLKADLKQLKINYQTQQLAIEKQIKFIKSSSPRELIDQ